MPERRVTARQRQVVVERARECCEYCRSQARFATQSFSVEHITPRSQGGKTRLDNLALACQGCNNHKYTKTEGHDPVSGELVLLYHPRHHQWSDHFRWSDDFTLIVGVTPTGRATIEALQLNRMGLVNLRQVLYTLGEHPLSEIVEDE
jgi:5-methylcytosine-specific restriction endonuclease McrA